MLCDTVRTKLSSYMDHELSEHDHTLVAAHLLQCQYCEKEMQLLLSAQVMLKQASPLAPSAVFQKRVLGAIHAERFAVRPPTLADRLIRWWLPVPVLAAALVLVFVVFTVLSPMVYATTSKNADTIAMSKAALISMVGTSIVSPANFAQFCTNCHMALCENCKKGQQCECK